MKVLDKKKKVIKLGRTTILVSSPNDKTKLQGLTADCLFIDDWDSIKKINPKFRYSKPMPKILKNNKPLFTKKHFRE